MRAVVVSAGGGATVCDGLAALGWDVDRRGSEALETEACVNADLLAIDLACISAADDPQLLARIRRRCPQTGVFAYGEGLPPICEDALNAAPDIPVVRTGAPSNLLRVVVDCACALPPV